jgi:hypothetical protein
MIVFAAMTLAGCGSKPTVKWESQKYNAPKSPVIKVYMENSGSMDGYMCPGSELKDAVYSYVSALNVKADTTELNYINTQVVPCRLPLQAFVRDLTPATLHGTGGDTSHSEISDMLQMILGRMNDHTLSVFISDCIIDVPQGDAANYLNLRQTDITNAITTYLKAHKDMGVEVMHMESKFDGMLYGPQGARRYNGTRPYYIIIMGSRHQLAMMNKAVPQSDIQHGVKHYCAFASAMDVPFELTNTFGMSSPRNQIDLNSARDGAFTLKANADLAYTLQSDDYLADPKHYDIDSESLTVDKVEKGKDPYTHMLTLGLAKGFRPSKICVAVKLESQPQWLGEADTQTTGIRQIVTGIAHAFADKSSGQIAFTVVKR